MGCDTAVIFAGGRSSRMKQDKALLPFGEEPTLAEFQYRRLQKLFTNVYISSKSNKFNFSAELIEDNYSESSPMVALVSIFETLKVDEVFVLSVDAPFVTEEIIEKLYRDAKKEVDVVVAHSKERIEPLCAIYRRSCLALAIRALKENKHGLQRLFKRLNVQEVNFKEEDSFMNLNYPQDYSDALLRSSIT